MRVQFLCVSELLEKTLNLIILSPLGTNGCISGFTISAQTGGIRGAGFSSSYMNGRKHLIKLFLQDGNTMQATLPSPAYRGYLYRHKLTDFGFNNRCVRPSDIIEVKLIEAPQTTEEGDSEEEAKAKEAEAAETKEPSEKT